MSRLINFLFQVLIVVMMLKLIDRCDKIFDGILKLFGLDSDDKKDKNENDKES